MHSQNPVHNAIRQVMKPIIDNRRLSVEGTIQAIDYQSHVARIWYVDPQSNVGREIANVPIPVDGDGVFKQGLEEGDVVTLGWKNGNIENPYISAIHQKFRGINYQSKYGAGIPKGMGAM
jgi:hypothetical protein